MDRRVKERLIGASILVALVVLVVPELLSGPKPNTAPAPTLPAAAPEPVRNVTVDLTTSRAPATADSEPAGAPSAASAASAATSISSNSSAANAPAGEIPAARSPAPSGAAASATAPISNAPAKSVAKPAAAAAAARPAAVESAALSPTSNGPRSWSVQLGSFASRVNAENLTRQVKGQGFSVFVLPGGSGSSVRYRVRVGPLADRESAERMAAKLKSLGHVGSLVAPAA
jgi:DedD protein